MHKRILFFLLFLPLFSVAQGDLGFYFQDVTVIPADFEVVSKNFDINKKETLHSLRTYIEAKESALDEVTKKIEILHDDMSINMIDTIIGKQYLSLVDSCKESAELDGRIKHYLGNLGYMAQFYGDRKVGDIDVITQRVRKKVFAISKDYAIIQILHTSKKNLNDDINKAQLHIDTLYSKLYDEGKFKIWITGFFSFIVAGLLLYFFIFISRKSETTLAKDFLSSGNGLQFITLFSLVIAIILFGVLGVLEGRELAAILSGISGYILGKGIQNPKRDNKPSQPTPQENEQN